MHGPDRSRRWRRARAALLAVAAAIGPASPIAAEPAGTSNDPDFGAGRQAIERKDWTEAIARFTKAALREPDNADIESYLGFAHRNLGQMAPAFEHYRRALTLDPRHRGAHEYVGEAYLLVGDLAKAEEHLAALRGICLLGCEALTDLEQAIADYRQRGGRPRTP